MFGSTIVEICSSFEAYGEFLLQYPQRQTVLSEMEEEEGRIALEESAQKIVFRTYKLTLLL